MRYIVVVLRITGRHDAARPMELLVAPLRLGVTEVQHTKAAAQTMSSYHTSACSVLRVADVSCEVALKHP